MNEYEQQAIDFANKIGMTMTIGNKSFEYSIPFPDKRHWIFTVVFRRHRDFFGIDFSQSIANGDKEPSMYDVLACLTKYDPGSFKDFCHEFGYNDDSIKDHGIYEAVKDEWELVNSFFYEDELEELRDIQ